MAVPIEVTFIKPYPAGFSGSWNGDIAAGQSQSVPVTFRPTAEQSYGGNLTVNSNKTLGTHTKSISGRGTPVPTRIIGLSGGNLAFGDVEKNKTKTSTLMSRNPGNPCVE